MKIKEAVNRIESTSKSTFAWEHEGYIHIAFNTFTILVVPYEAKTMFDCHFVNPNLELPANLKMQLDGIVGKFLRTPIKERFPEKKYRVRLIGFNSDNGKQYLTTEKDNSNPLGHKFFACALRAGLKQEFTMDELSTIANKYEFKAVPWIQDLLRNIEPVEDKNDGN